MIFVDKKYKQNDRIPSESELAKELNVSRTSIREAIKILIANNILIIRRGVGTFVQGDVNPAINPFDVFYSSNKRQLVKDTFEIRLLLEVEAAKLAAMRATEEDIREIEQAENECAKRIEAGMDYDKEDQNFHASIAKAAHNLVLIQITPLLQLTIDATLHAYSNYKDAETKLMSSALHYHKEILRFIKERDANGAGFAMYSHISNTARIINNPVLLDTDSEAQETNEKNKK